MTISNISRRSLLKRGITTAITLSTIGSYANTGKYSKTLNGITINKNISNVAKCLKSSGIDFVVRYYSSLKEDKILTKNEADVIINSNLNIVPIYQNISQANRDFSSHNAINDAKHVINYANNVIGQSPNSAIFFAIDYDASKKEIDKYILPYFETVANKLASSNYQVGVYGSGLTCRIIKDEMNLAKYSILSLTYKWRESLRYHNWDIYQGFAKGVLCNISGEQREMCKTKAGAKNYGQFSIIE